MDRLYILSKDLDEDEGLITFCVKSDLVKLTFTLMPSFYVALIQTSAQQESTGDPGDMQAGNVQDNIK